MQTVSSFLQFSEGEQVLEEWEFLSDPGKIHAKDILAFIILVLIGGGILLAAASAGADNPIPFLIGAGAIYLGANVLWDAITRPDTTGTICLTNWRFLYYQEGRGTGIKRRHHHVSSANLEDILGIYSVYHEGFMGVKNLYLQVHTRYEDGIRVAIGDSGGLLSKIPGIGKIFRRTTIGKDAYHVLPVLFKLVQERQGAMIETSSEY